MKQGSTVLLCFILSGIGEDVVAAVLADLADETGITLQTYWDAFVVFCRQRKYYPKSKCTVSTSLGSCAKSSFPSISMEKGADTRMAIAWMATLLIPDPMLDLAVCSLADYCYVMDRKLCITFRC